MMGKAVAWCHLKDWVVAVPLVNDLVKTITQASHRHHLSPESADHPANLAAMPSAEVVEATKKRVRDAVTLFEHKEGSKTVDIKEIPSLVRYLGVNPTGVQLTHCLDQLASLNADAGADNTSLLSSEVGVMLS
jgi:hypothetical protein